MWRGNEGCGGSTDLKGSERVENTGRWECVCGRERRKRTARGGRNGRIRKDIG